MLMIVQKGEISEIQTLIAIHNTIARAGEPDVKFSTLSLMSSNRTGCYCPVAEFSKTDTIPL
jgi:hypothetical protein